MPSRSDNDRRPVPDALLAAAAKEGRGRLKIFMGAAPGVGKTYAMLEAARVKAMSGVDVAIGVVETHGRTETAELQLGLDIVPRVKIEYRGTVLEELDVDAILTRRPQLVLVDELAHTNAPGSRHLKRYLDVEELLEAGIDVYTTLNVQHLESLNDAVAQITGVRVRETVPDRILARADEVEVVDLSVEDLLERLRQGKVYIPDQAERAIRSYFRPGNLAALRQLALRQAAEQVDEEMHTYMQAHAIPGPWPATERLLVSIGPSPLSRRLVRACRRRAERRHAEWIAAYVETARHHRMSEEDRDRVAATMRLAEELGGEVVVIPGAHVAEELLELARRRNVTEIVVGKSLRPWWFEFLHGSIVRDLIKGSGAIDVHVIAATEGEPAEMPPPAVRHDQRRHWSDDYVLPVVAVAISGVVAALLKSALSLPNLSMVFLAAVLVSAVARGLRASIAASIMSVLVYNYFFVPPQLTFTVSSSQDILALIVYLAVAVLTSNLAGRIRDQAAGARRREEQTSALYAMSRAIVGARGLRELLDAVVVQVSHTLDAAVAILLPDTEGLAVRAVHPVGLILSEAERGAATWAWGHDTPVGRGTDTLPGERWLYLPLRTANGIVGIMGLRFEEEGRQSPDVRRVMEALCEQAAVAIERARLAADIDLARIASERERLQAVLLSSISHDLRTPLASILGAVTGLEQGGAYTGEAKRELLTTIREEGERLNRFVGNLLDTMRIESGALRLNREWIEVGDVIGTAIARLAGPLAGHPLDIVVEERLPLLHLDFVLMEQVLVNLLDNAAKYSDASAAISVRARRADDMVIVDVEDQGMGIPRDDLELIFDRFYRVQQGDRKGAGTGLGLSICRGIVEEHGGNIIASSPGPSGRGSLFTIRLPIDPSAPIVNQHEGSS